MKNLTKAAAVLFLSLNLISWAGAGLESETLKASDFGRVEMTSAPEIPAPVMEVEQGSIASGLELFSCFGYTEARGAFAAFSRSAALYSINLESIKNVYLKPDTTFITGKGTRVYVSGAKASNCPDGGSSCQDREKFFMILTTDKNETFFLRAMEMVNWGPISGSKTVVIDGEKYMVKIYANSSNSGNSKLEIKGPSGVVFAATVGQVGDAIARKGVDVELSKAYKLVYGNEIVQDPKGARF
ncbi:MAG: hypothetical protein AAB359_09415, partial [Elusimicrobiota bacterium]